MSFVEAIAAKRDGLPLTREQVAEFVAGATSGAISSEQLSAMLMAICVRGMDPSETRWLTEAMLHSGEVWDFASLNPDAIDKHSTGGVGDTVSLVLAPLLASVGVPVAMMAGRGLGHSQGTLDKLEAIPGFDSHRDRAETLALIDSCGAAVVAQTEEIAPADKTLYALRDITATVPSLPLIVSSIMSKKLALGANTLILDVKFGSGAFRKTVADALELASALREVARGMGMRSEAILTDMNQPLGPALGTACEVREAIAVLEDRGDDRLREVSLRVCCEAMVLRGWDRQGAVAALEAALTDGSARARWDQFVVAHGGDPDPRRLPDPMARVEVGATSSGFVATIDAERLGRVAVDVGAGRRQRGEDLALGAGLKVRVRLGDEVEKGQPVATLLVGDRTVDVERTVARVAASFSVAEQPPPSSPLILGTVDMVTEADVR